DAVLRVHAQQPFVRAVGGSLVDDHLWRAHFGAFDELFTQRLRDIGHRVEVRHAGAVDPFHDLARAERLLADRDEVFLHLLARHSEQVGSFGGVVHCVSRYCVNVLRIEDFVAWLGERRGTGMYAVVHEDSEEFSNYARRQKTHSQRVRAQISSALKKNAISFFAVSAASEPCTTFSSTVFAKSARIVPGAASFGLVAPITSRFFAMALSPSSTCTITGPETANWTRSS